ncbi:hypothetical protein DFH07DRAFT_971359 [Mycena maculata]|uniref:F-box domain-containing protein n=1 Tax=Mycena maculata TaxID=230809 RepID=A0AAD7HNN0_9AGAR|nr:hypothetical protein DFH07DRAFT_971359 [Mycena maculata]
MHINKIPDELLAKIMRMHAGVFRDSLIVFEHSRKTVCCVSSWWRAVGLADAVLWAHLRIQPLESYLYPTDPLLVEKCIRRSHDVVSTRAAPQLPLLTHFAFEGPSPATIRLMATVLLPTLRTILLIFDDESDELFEPVVTAWAPLFSGITVAILRFYTGDVHDIGYVLHAMPRLLFLDLDGNSDVPHAFYDIALHWKRCLVDVNVVRLHQWLKKDSVDAILLDRNRTFGSAHLHLILPQSAAKNCFIVDHRRQGMRIKSTIHSFEVDYWEFVPR